MDQGQPPKRRRLSPSDHQERRQNDLRIEQIVDTLHGLDRSVTDLDTKVDQLRDWLITEADASPLGRALKFRADTNAKNIETNRQQHDADVRDIRAEFAQFKRDEFRPINEWWNRSQGAWKAFTGASVVLGLIATALALLAYFDK